MKPGKTFVPEPRLAVYDAIVNQVPTSNIPILITKFASRFDVIIDQTPHRNTVEMMARELDVIASVQTAEATLTNEHVTLGFDATTQEGVHINSIHVTTRTDCYVIAVDELPGGTALDYSSHNLSRIYGSFTATSQQQCRLKLISNISNCMMDRVAVNHAAIVVVNEAWDKTVTELNCYLHPLDTIASAARASLKPLEDAKGKLFGNDCMAGNLVLQLNKLRYKDGKGYPRVVSRPWMRSTCHVVLCRATGGYRLHILFHICGRYIEEYDAVLGFLTSGTVACGGLTAAIANDFASATAKCELQVLGLLGKLFTGPWMRKFYTAADTETSHVDGINVARDAIATLKSAMTDPCGVLSSSCYFLGGRLDEGCDATLHALMQPPDDAVIFAKMMTAVMAATVTVLERQYKKHFAINVTDTCRGNTIGPPAQHRRRRDCGYVFRSSEEGAECHCLLPLFNDEGHQKQNG